MILPDTLRRFSLLAELDATFLEELASIKVLRNRTLRWFTQRPFPKSPGDFRAFV
jgi:hypothetical protein